ncbi:DUF2177 family protein [Polynucleobacter sp. AP-Latsch-80-C2]|uniref:DUF2177 family protein n=1 Tax=Polynucleobacter sp. AP-Latsch-80-C2 TaxID=2576931 RepID=UPI001C0D6D81|nr:DUF2177 family protein [Polynucleobacter sp. AP-Latsch-80-C2]MBU3622968.1 DUF2177 family protein [Polynucleobacter sp. AP-Latsch-80-C2]
MLKYFGVYLVFLITLVAIDLVWLLGIARNLYQQQMGELMATEPKLIAGLAFYVLYALGVCIFVIVPALSKQSWIYAVQYGALFGFFCYMTYDLTNLAVIRNFPTGLAFIDIAWGSAVTAVTAGFAYWVVNRFFE